MPRRKSVRWKWISPKDASFIAFVFASARMLVQVDWNEMREKLDDTSLIPEMRKLWMKSYRLATISRAGHRGER